LYVVLPPFPFRKLMPPRPRGVRLAVTSVLFAGHRPEWFDWPANTFCLRRVSVRMTRGALDLSPACAAGAARTSSLRSKTSSWIGRLHKCSRESPAAAPQETQAHRVFAPSSARRNSLESRRRRLRRQAASRQSAAASFRPVARFVRPGCACPGLPAGRQYTAGPMSRKPLPPDRSRFGEWYLRSVRRNSVLTSRLRGRFRRVLSSGGDDNDHATCCPNFVRRSAIGLVPLGRAQNRYPQSVFCARASKAAATGGAPRPEAECAPSRWSPVSVGFEPDQVPHGASRPATKGAGSAGWLRFEILLPAPFPCISNAVGEPVLCARLELASRTAPGAPGCSRHSFVATKLRVLTIIRDH